MNLNTKMITRTGVLLALTLAIQFMKLPQFITGAGVNAMLLITVMAVGVLQGGIIGCITPVIAIMVGIIKPPMAPVIPFIAASNVLLVVIFHTLRKKNDSLALIVAALTKFLVLYGAVRLFLVNILPNPVFEKVAIAFGVTQLFTALAGGFIAMAVMKLLHNYLKQERDIKG